MSVETESSLAWLCDFRVEVARRIEEFFVTRVRDEQRRHRVRLSAKRSGNAAFHTFAVVALAIGLGDNHRNVAFLEHIHALGKRMRILMGTATAAELGHTPCSTQCARGLL